METITLKMLEYAAVFLAFCYAVGTTRSLQQQGSLYYFTGLKMCTFPG